MTYCYNYFPLHFLCALYFNEDCFSSHVNKNTWLLPLLFRYDCSIIASATSAAFYKIFICVGLILPIFCCNRKEKRFLRCKNFSKWENGTWKCWHRSVHLEEIFRVHHRRINKPMQLGRANRRTTREKKQTVTSHSLSEFRAVLWFDDVQNSYVHTW